MVIRVQFSISKGVAQTIARLYGDGPPTEYMLNTWAKTLIDSTIQDIVADEQEAKHGPAQ